MSSAGRRRHSHRRTPFVAVGLLMGSGAAALTVVAVSVAALSSTTHNADNGWESALVSITDDDAGSTLFSTDDLLAGDKVTRCITVAYTGTADHVGPLTLYATAADAAELAPYLQLTVIQGRAGTSARADCSDFPATGVETILEGTLAASTAAHNSYATGVGNATPSRTAPTVPYRFDVVLDATTPTSQQGNKATVVFTWEIRSPP